MTRKTLYVAAMAMLAALAWCAETPAPGTQAQTAAKKSATGKKQTVPAKTAPAKTGAATRTGVASARTGGTPTRRAGAGTQVMRTAASRSARRPVPRTTWRNRQMAPSPERYKEIQEALVSKGYLQPEEAGGAWGQSSADALKRFQADQNLESTGKINSLSLIALGLGPKHDNVTVPKPPVPPVQ